ncbi:MAG: beta-N-acetylhexosaminidase [Zymomonas mobilis]|uniref:beta-N-acetylhexosaminidase n=1 Tax=Zymomonas mobilis TaxID=542 RepID=A0A542W1U3_ZYMMB|nr:beta-N-acetylhexosaminidase [Zymomonas mobilis]TQL17546.1 beta-N-acetylhexosaminidase [Zymomonas mobilis]
MKPVFIGIASPQLSDQEKKLFQQYSPAGYILFQRNITDRLQLKKLTDDLKQNSSKNVPILIDQEGGRVARMKPPVWPAFPTAECFDILYQKAPASAIEAVRANSHALACLLQDVGINVDCMPLLDIRDPEGNNIIGDRSFGNNPEQVAALGQAALDGLENGGVCGVIKHIPGHGQAKVDSHKALPIVDSPLDILERDIKPFQRLHNAKMAMTAHVTYLEWDKENCASYSPSIIRNIIREKIGFNGLLMSDDIGMNALDGDPVTRALRVLEAGCDIALHCSGKFEEMEAILKSVGDIKPESLTALEKIKEGFTSTSDFDLDKAEDKALFDALITKRDSLLAV